VARYTVSTPGRQYDAIIERGILERIDQSIPSRSGKIFIVTTIDVWQLHGEKLGALADATPLFFPGGEIRKRLSEVEVLADQMALAGADRSSIVIGFGGGIVTDMAGFLAASFMRGVPVLQVPTTLLAQVDAAVGGKTGVNLVSGKNLFGAFHQPLAVLIDPSVVTTLPPREYVAGLYEIIKCGVIRDAALFDRMESSTADILKQDPALVDGIIADAVRIKCEVVSADEREGGLRRILNFGHTIGHALEAETEYKLFLHGEAVAFGMHAATELAVRTGHLDRASGERIRKVIGAYGEIPSARHVPAENLVTRTRGDKKTVQGKVHYVLPVKIGETTVVSDIPDEQVLAAILAVQEGDAR
jgi:3-dehydroquinate synthase